MSPLEPKLDMMRRHLELMSEVPETFRDGLIEIAYDLKCDGAPNGAKLFQLTELHDAIKFAEAKNRAEHNVWLGVALRQPTTPRDKRTGNGAFYVSAFVVVDTDEDTLPTGERLDEIATPELVVTTGTFPELRQQKWYRLSKPCVDKTTFAQAVERVVKHVGGDASALGAARLMRLAGSVSYPRKPKKITKGYVKELTAIETLAKGHMVDVETFLALAPRDEPSSDDNAVPQESESEKDGDNFFGNVNRRALRRLDAWVPAIFGFDAVKQSNGGYRISSESLGRELEEDLSIHPDGIKDFGVHDLGDARGGRRSAIDIVMEHSGDENGIRTLRDAAFWLCQQMKIDPSEIGWRRTAGEQMTAPAESVARSSGDDGKPSRQSPDELLLSAWLKRDLPPRDYLLGNILCSTSRWLLWGDTGIGKTLFACEMAAAVAAGAAFLNWTGRRRSRVMYLDGEMPAETFKERMVLVAGRHGGDIALFGYSREVLGSDEMPALNTPDGEAWLWREIDAVKPDIVFFDSIMCLLAGSMSEEETWAPVKALIRKISSRRIAQIWLHHTGHDATKAFGTKTREWEMDTVVALTKRQDDGSVELDFRKARLRTPQTHAEFRTLAIACGEAGWTASEVQVGKTKNVSEAERLIDAIVQAYDRLAVGVEPCTGLDCEPVKKVSVDQLRDEVKSRGLLDTTQSGGLTPAARKSFQRAKLSLFSRSSGGFVESEGLLWKKPPVTP